MWAWRSRRNSFSHWKGLSKNWYSQRSVKVRKLGRTLEEKLKMEGCHGAPGKDVVPAWSRVKMEVKDCMEGQWEGGEGLGKPALKIQRGELILDAGKESHRKKFSVLFYLPPKSLFGWMRPHSTPLEIEQDDWSQNLFSKKGLCFGTVIVIKV